MSASPTWTTPLTPTSPCRRPSRRRSTASGRCGPAPRPTTTTSPPRIPARCTWWREMALLNTATKVYRGAVPALVVYRGSTRVWPPTPSETQLRLAGPTLASFMVTPDQPSFPTVEIDVTWFGSLDDVLGSNDTLISQYQGPAAQKAWWL